MSATRFLDQLESQGMLEPSVIDELRRHVAKVNNIKPETVAKLLIDKGHLTQFQATKLLGKVQEQPVKPVTADDDLGLAPFDDQPPTPVAKASPAAKKPAPAAADDMLDLLPLDEDKPAAAPAPKKAGAPAPKPVPKPSANDDLELLPFDEPAAPAKAAKPAATKVAAKPAAIDAGLELLPMDEQPVAAPPPPKTKPAATKVAAKPAAIDAGLDLLPLDEQPVAAPPPPKTKPAAAPAPAAELELIDLEETAPAAPSPAKQIPVRPAATKPAAKPRSGIDASTLTPIDPRGLLPDAGLAPLDAGLMPTDAGLGPLGGPDAFAPPPGFGSPSGTAAPAKPATPRALAHKSVWDSKFMLVGGGALLFLVILGGALYYMMHRESADEMFQAADASYKGLNYADAISKYEKFAAKFPKDSNASLARVKIGLAKIRQVADGARDLKTGLTTAKQVLPEIENEAKFPDARGELAALLPDIAEGFAKNARTTTKMNDAQSLVDLAGEAMLLVDNPNYLPTSMRKTQQSRIDGIKENITLAQRAINQDNRLRDALTEIERKVASADTVAAFEVRRQLLREYPELEVHKDLRDATLRVAEKERDRVQVVEQPLAPQTTDNRSPSENRIVLVNQTLKGSKLDIPATLFVLARGAVYGIEVGSGKVAWRRFVGTDTWIQPRPIADEAGADCLAVDVRKHELLRLKATSGDLVWRTSLGEKFSAPVPAAGKVYVTTDSGKLIELDAATGEAKRHAQIPQPVRVGPGVHDNQKRLYLLGEHSNLYAIDSETMRCDLTLYLGHKVGMVAAPPVVVAGYVFVAINTETDLSLVHIFATDQNGLALQPASDPLRLPGQVKVPPFLQDRRIVIVTDLGAIHVLSVDPNKPKTPVAYAVAPAVPPYSTSTLGYPLLEKTRLWIGDERLAKYEVQTAQNKLARVAATHDGDSFFAPPQAFGDLVVYSRKPKNTHAVSVTALQAASGQVVWQTDLAVPLGKVILDRKWGPLAGISSHAELFRITAEMLKPDAAGKPWFLDKPVYTARFNEEARAFTTPVDLDDGRIAFYSPADNERVLVFDPQHEAEAVRLVKPLVGARVTTPPIPLAGGIIVPLSNGQVAHHNLQPQEQMKPFQPRVEPGQTVQWRRPAAVAADQFVIADDKRQLYRVGIKMQPQPHLSQLAQVETPAMITGPLATVGGTLYATTRGENTDVIASFQLPTLQAGMTWPLEGHVVWGPEQVGELVLFASDAEGLMCFEAGQKLRWKSPLKQRALAGRPLLVDGDLILTSTRGEVWRLAGATGQELKSTVLEEPLGTGPVAAGKTRLLVGGADGVVHILPMLAP